MVQMFYQHHFKLYQDDEAFDQKEPLLFKLIFSSYSEPRMMQHGFDLRQLDDSWRWADRMRKRKRNIKLTKNFLSLKVVEEIWFAKNGFL